MNEDILVRQEGPVLNLTLNRPEAGNGVTDEMAARLAGLLLGAAETSRLVVLRGAGDDFCTGRASGRPPMGATEALQRRRATEVIFDCYGAFRKTPIPIVSLVQGRALGFGCSIAALCDITIATDNARFQIPEMSHRIMPTMVMSSLVDRLSRKAISHLVYTSAVIGPERALAFGIVGDVVESAQAESALAAVVKSILDAPAPATEGVKEYLRSAMNMDVQGAVDFARNVHATINSSSEMKKS
ncbi:MAG: enoyl-CoA hydratase/carnithine racemase [Hyphomicrobiales bacterium]|nr:enoyl-CoA hydratase/carnithine racemase [Hyphomicrobiales bacterium]